MEEGELPYNHEDDVRGQDISVGNAEIKTNGHREDINPQEFLETMRSKRMEVQSYREDNQKDVKGSRTTKWVEHSASAEYEYDIETN